MCFRFFIEEKIEKDQSEIIISDTHQAYKISRVLRKKTGDNIIVLDNSGFEFFCEIKQAAKKLILLKILKNKKNSNEPKFSIALHQSIIKKDKMDFVFEKCTEIGVSSFCPIVSEHSVKLSLKEERMQKILKEAAEQSRRGKIPKLFKIEKFKTAVKNCNKEDINIIFHEKEKRNFLINFLINNKEIIKNGNKEINLFVGPEGGFSDEEIKIAKAAGFNIFSLGKRTLRAETAAIFSSSLIASFE